METRALTVTQESPSEVIAAAQLAAKELKHLIDSQPNRLVVGGKQYLFFEDWQTLGKFYGVSARVLSTEELTRNKQMVGYLAKAAAVQNGYEISTAEAECTISENNWHSKPMFQLRSMAQTRACAKALRNCLGWVAVLGGYESQPAEEMELEDVMITPAQRRHIFAFVREGGYSKEEVQKFMFERWNISSTNELTKEQAGELIELMKANEPLSKDMLL